MHALFYFLTLNFIVLQNSYAFKLMTNVNASFSGASVKVYITSNSTCSNAGRSAQEILDLTMEGADKFWNRVGTANFKIKRGGILTTSDSLYLTGELCASDSSTTCNSATTVPTANDIIIACNSESTVNFPQTNIFALTAPTNLSSSQIKGSVILINDTGGSEFANLSKDEVINVMAHELGHAIGIGHTNRNEALMHTENFDSKYVLAQDDRDAISYLYPNQLDGCTSIFGTISDKKDSSSGPFLLSLLIGIFIPTILSRKKRKSYEA